jgi:hypothetical protein
MGLLAAVQYGLTAGPGLYWRDSGELAAAGISLGIGHPTILKRAPNTNIPYPLPE